MRDYVDADGNTVSAFQLYGLCPSCGRPRTTASGLCGSCAQREDETHRHAAQVQYLDRLDQRRRYLAARREAKRHVGLETVDDQSEHDALNWAIATLRDDPRRAI